MPCRHSLQPLSSRPSPAQSFMSKKRSSSLSALSAARRVARLARGRAPLGVARTEPLERARVAAPERRRRRRVDHAADAVVHRDLAALEALGDHLAAAVVEGLGQRQPVARAEVVDLAEQRAELELVRVLALTIQRRDVDRRGRPREQPAVVAPHLLDRRRAHDGVLVGEASVAAVVEQQVDGRRVGARGRPREQVVARVRDLLEELRHDGLVLPVARLP